MNFIRDQCWRQDPKNQRRQQGKSVLCKPCQFIKFDSSKKIVIKSQSDEEVNYITCRTKSYFDTQKINDNSNGFCAV